MRANAETADARPKGALPKSLLIHSSTAARIPAAAALSPGLSESDWGALACSERGLDLLKQAELLLDRRAKLQETLSEIWLGPEGARRQKEWIEADMELRAVNKELSEFPARAKAMIDQTTPKLEPVGIIVFPCP